MSNDFICCRCGFETDEKRYLVKHLQRKTLCDPLISSLVPEFQLTQLTKKTYNDNAVSCPHCDKRFNDPSNRSKHIKICKKNLENTPKADIIKELIEIKEQLAKFKNLETVSNVTQNNNNVVGNTTNIHINSFGRETFDHLPLDFLTSCFMMKNMESLVENIYFDKDCPENHNVKLKSSKQKTVEVFEDGLWRVKHSDDVADDIINKGHSLLYSHYRKNKDAVKEDMSDIEIEEVLDWLHKIFENDNITRQPIKRDLILLFQTYRNQIK
jgi:hypothetical protein